MADQEELLKKRLLELAQKSYQSNCYVFTGFLNEMEQDCFYRIEKQINYVHYTMSGGFPGAERVMIRFGNPEEFGYEEDFPIQCIKAEPLMQKFADTFTHRDFLGAIMNLGIERSEVGDIVLKENRAYIFVSSKMASFIMEQLDQVKHTHIRCMLTEGEVTELARKLQKEEIQASSERLDGVVAKVYKMSRNACLELFRTQKIFVNGRLMENNSYALKEEDTVSVRGYGKFIYCGVSYITKKGKQNIVIERYV